MEIVDVPDPLSTEWEFDDDRGRYLIKTDGEGYYSDADEVTLRISVTGDGGLVERNITEVVILGREGGRDNVYYEESGALGPLIEASREAGDETVEDTVSLPFDGGDIFAQYDDDGNYNLQPGEVTIRVEIARGNPFYPMDPLVAEAPTTFAIPDDVGVKENTRIGEITIGHDGTTISPQVALTVVAKHEVDLPLRVSASIGGEQIHTADVVAEELTGAVEGLRNETTTQVSLPSFELSSVPYDTNTLRYTVAPRKWATRKIDPVTVESEIPNISVDDVEVTGCRVTPEQVIAGDQVTVRSSVSNPLPVAVGVEGRIDFAGERSTFVRQIGAGEVASVTKTFRTTEPGTAQPEIRLTSVGGNV